MEWLESLGLAGLFFGTFLAATIFPFSSDALYMAVLAATADPVGCLIAGTLGNWLGSVLTYFTVVGDVIAIALGFYKVRPGWTIMLMLVGKFARFLVWNLIYGLF